MNFLKVGCVIALNSVFFLLPQAEAANILYLNSIRGAGTIGLGPHRNAIANTLDDYGDGSIFDVDFVQAHASGDLAFFLNAQPIDYYDQIWFDTSILFQSILNEEDLNALNIWSANDQPEFILDSSFAFRNKQTSTLQNSARSVTINAALALQSVGGGILIGTDHNSFAKTANQILENFGFDDLFTGSFNITSDASFVGNLFLEPEPVSSDFFSNNLQFLSTSNVPVGKHVLNKNGGDRTIEIYENLFSTTLRGEKIVHIGASFNTGSHVTDISDLDDNVPTNDVPTPATGIISIVVSISAWFRKKKRERSGIISYKIE
ncbi:MAG: hypothetical protein HC799_10645 [Limnothrix sp. RL_2_0]|nr:hypothetical protein [Limnothrix sp. RL_2_0]